MANYFKTSFEKFKQDTLSKLFYDIIIKWLIPVAAVSAFSGLFPESTTIGQLLSKKVSVSYYFVLLLLLSVIIITVIVVGLLFYKRYNALKASSMIDELTGVKNHKAFTEYLNQVIDESGRTDKVFSIIIIDVDDFKKFNSVYGSSTADGILGELGLLLQNDKRVTDEVFRQFLRGDEFVIIANDTSLNDALRAAERKRLLIERTTFSVNEDSCRLSVSCGVTECKRGKDDFKSITDRVSKALTDAKSQDGKNNTKSRV